MNADFEGQPGPDASSAEEESLRGIDEILEIEALLRRMPLRRPGATLDARVLSARRRPVVRRRIGWAAAAALVAAAGAAPWVTHRLTTRDTTGGVTAGTGRVPQHV